MPFRWQDFGAENLTRGDDTTDGMAARQENPSMIKVTRRYGGRI